MCDHLKQAKESYFQHMKVAGTLASLALLAGLVLIVHAVLPCVFKTTGSTLFKTIQYIVDNRL
jgi:hypothetical protein